MKILGISAYYHDAAACLVIDGEIIAAAQEERFTRKKHDSNFPVNAMSYCLVEGKISSKDIDYVVFYDKPFLKFERLLETYLAFAPRGFKSFVTSLPIWLKDKLFNYATKFVFIGLHKPDKPVKSKKRMYDPIWITYPRSIEWYQEQFADWTGPELYWWFRDTVNPINDWYSIPLGGLANENRI